jgi:hypothetical protein
MGRAGSARTAGVSRAGVAATTRSPQMRTIARAGMPTNFAAAIAQSGQSSSWFGSSGDGAAGAERFAAHAAWAQWPEWAQSRSTAVARSRGA